MWDVFGWSVDRDAGTTIVGAWGEGPVVPGIGYGDASGAAYVFSGGVQKLTASDGDRADAFGYSVAIDGERAAVGAPGDGAVGGSSGAVYLFAKDEAGAWSERAKLTPPEAKTGGFGMVVELGGDTVVVGSWHQGASGPKDAPVYTYRWSAETVSLEATLQADPAFASADGSGFGSYPGSLSLDGDILAVGAPIEYLGPGNLPLPVGSVYLFERGPNGDWAQTDRVIPPSNHRAEVTGTRLPGPVCLPDPEPTCLTRGWNVTGSLFGYAVDVHDDRLVVGEPGNEGVILYQHTAGVGWEHLETFRSEVVTSGAPPDLLQESTRFGHAVDLDDGGFVVSAPGSFGTMGRTYFFTEAAGSWAWEQLLPDPHVSSRGTPFFTFGYDVGYDGDVAIVGYPFATKGSTGGDKFAGAVYEFGGALTRPPANWCAAGLVCL